MHLQVLGRLDQKNILPWIHIPLQSPNIQWLHSSSKHSWWCEEAPSWLFLHPFILIFMHSWGANTFFIVPAPQNLPPAFIPRWVSCTDEPHLVAFSGLVLDIVTWKSCFPLQKISTSVQALHYLYQIKFHWQKFEVWLTTESQSQFYTHPTKSTAINFIMIQTFRECILQL